MIVSMIRFSTLFTLLLLLGTTTLSAQDVASATDYLQQKYADLGLEAGDVSDLVVTDDYTSDGIRHVYVNQRFQGVPVFNAQAAFHYRGTTLLRTSNRFAANLAAQNLSTAPAFSAQLAVNAAIGEVASTFAIAAPAGSEDETLLFSLPDVSEELVRAKLVFLPTDRDGIRLAWNVMVDQYNSKANIWTIFIDAQTGDLLGQHNHVIKCSFGGTKHTHRSATNHTTKTTAALVTAGVADGSSYNVFPFGVESPLHGDRMIVNEPADEIASPFGWHDTDGNEGPEFTITRGNNAWAYPDRDNDNATDPGGVYDGGDSLTFDFYYADDAGLDTLLPAATTQLFYSTNAIHDWLYHAGFNEPSGNFQRTNYKNEGEERDPVLAQAQDAADLTGAEEGINNANFATPPDGQSPRMQMYKWRSDAQLMTGNFPESIAGGFVTGLGFGPVIASDPTTGEVAYSEPADGCVDFTNDLTGKIALITRGTCEFGVKVLNAENAGAIAAIICNDAALGEDRGGTITMGAGAVGNTVTIPNVFLSLENCIPLRMALENGDSVSVTLQATAPPFVDGDFDAGIVAHEIGHGVSNRLVGGPNNTSCLFTDEQMGEGWSDFFALASSPKALGENPDGTEGRGIGNFATSAGINGRGIRRKQYSTDFAVNNFTYDDIITSGIPHPLGEIWSVTLWDLYWAMVDEYGFDEDLIRGTGGNNLAVRLVVEGMKFTDCGPGLIDGRNGILAADEAFFDGEYQCIIWDVFTRRGMGFSATAGSPDDRTDGVQAFDRSPYCVGGVQATKTVSEPTVQAGENVTFTIEVTNFDKMTATNVVVADVIPEGLTIDQATIQGADFTISGNTITFVVGELEFDDNQTIRYTASTDAEVSSVQSFFDGAEEGDDNWDILDISDGETGIFFWEQADTTPYAGELAWYIVNTAAAEDQVLQTFEPIAVTGANPGLRFFTKYETEIKWDAGIVEFSADGTNWEKVDDKFLRGGYRGEIDENGSAQLQDVGSFWGNSDGFREVILDISEFSGQSMYFRFRFVSDAAESGRAWWVDDIEILDMVNYNGQVTVSSNEFADYVTEAADYGVLVVGDIVDNTNDPVLGQTEVNIFPNPASDLVNVQITSERAGDATIQVLSVDGRVLRTERVALQPGGVTTSLETSALPAGMYLVQVTGASRVSTTKLTIN